jgi:hypothetical protein
MVWLFATFPEHHHSMVLNAYNECLFSPSSIRLEELDTLVSALGVDTVFSSACGDMWQRLYPSMARFDAFLTEPLGQWLMKHNIQPLPGLRIFRGRDQRVIMNGIDDTYADILARGPQSGYYVRNHSQEPKPKEDF